MRKITKITFYTLGGIILIVLLAIGFLMTPPGKRMVKNQIVAFLNKKLQADYVTLNKLDYNLPNRLYLQGLRIIDTKNETLLNVDTLEVKMKMLDLLSNKVTINEITVHGLEGGISRKNLDSAFNFQFIIDAFSGDTPSEEVASPSPEKKSGSPLQYDIAKVHLYATSFNMRDTFGGTNFLIKLDTLELQPNRVLLDSLDFGVEKLKIAGLQSNLVLSKSQAPPPPPDTTTAQFKLQAPNIDLSNINFSFLSQEDSFYYGINLALAALDIENFDLAKQWIAVNLIDIEQADNKLVMGKPGKQKAVTKPETDTVITESNWMIVAKRIQLKKVNYNQQDPSQPKQAKGIDYNYMHFTNVNILADSIFFSTDSMEANVKHVSLEEKSGLNIMELRTLARYTKHGAQLQKFFLQTPHTVLQNKLVVAYPSLASINKEMQNLKVDVRLIDSKIGMSDLQLFLPPSQQKLFAHYVQQYLWVDGEIKGSLKELMLHQLHVKGLTNTHLITSGTLYNAHNPDLLSYKLKIDRISTVYKDIAPWIPDSIARQYNLPNQISASGSLAGSMNRYQPNLQINTSMGGAKINGYLDMGKKPGNESYDLNIATQRLNIGQFLKMEESLGIVSAHIQARGKGFDPQKNMKASVDAKIIEAEYNKYRYHNLDLNANIEDQNVVYLVNSLDSNIDFTINGTANIGAEKTALATTIQLNNINLKALNFTTDTLSLAGSIQADFQNIQPDYPEGTLIWKDPEITFSNVKLPFDSIYLSAQAVDSYQNIQLNFSNILRLSAEGKIALTQIAPAILGHFNRYYPFTKDSVDLSRDYSFKVASTINYHPLLKRMYPRLYPFDTVRINLDMDLNNINGLVYAPRIRYGESLADSLYVRLATEEDLKYSASLHKLSYGQINLWNPTLAGAIRNDSVGALFKIADSTKKNQFAILGHLLKNNEKDTAATFFKLYDKLLFNYDTWDINESNYIAFGPNGINFNDINITRANQYIKIASETEEYNSPINLSIKDFSLANISTIINNSDTLIAEGNLNANVDVDLSQENMALDARVRIDSLRVFHTPLGQLMAIASNTNATTIATNLKLNDHQYAIGLNGDYYLTPQNGNDFNFKFNIDSLHLKTVEPLAWGSIKNSQGYINSNIDITGTTDRPVLQGQLSTHNLSTVVSMLGNKFTLPNEVITFTDKGILLKSFSIYDLNNRPAQISGTIRTRNYTNYFLNLNVSANRWQLLNSTAKDNEMFYGKLLASTSLYLRGLATAPEITGSLTIHDTTDFTFALIDNGPGVVSSEGIVKFYDSRYPWLFEEFELEKTNRRFSRNSSMNVNVEVDKNAIFNVLIDPSTGDNLQAKGTASLNTQINQDGSIGLTGLYEVNDGYYEYNFEFIKRKFKIQKGSTIMLSGDPLSADVQITAVYSANVAPYDLVERQISDPAQLVYFKQRLPFDILLNIKGKVMEPEITFDIVLPEEKASSVSAEIASSIQARLNSLRQNTSDINKQVFAVLTLGRFISDNPFHSGVSDGFEYAARQSVSRFLSNQLNQIAGQLISGLELNVDLNSSEDYTTGSKQNRSDINISASKRLFNDRLNVTVGSDFQIEGQQAQRQQSSLIPGNISLDYRLSADGRYNARAYRKNEFKNMIDGYVIETGVGFRVALSYNRFKYLFMNREKFLQRLRETRAKENNGQ